MMVQHDYDWVVHCGFNTDVLVAHLSVIVLTCNW